MTPGLGPVEARAAIALRDHGPVRAAGLVPHVWPNLKPSGSLNRGAGAMLARFRLHGWASIDSHSLFRITPEGKEAIVAAQKREADSIVSLAGGEVPEGARVCEVCGKCRRLEFFARKEGRLKTRYRKACRFCRQEQIAGSREKTRSARDASAQWTRASKLRIVAEVMALVRAARVARRTAMFRGKEGIAAYRALGDALEFFRSEQDPATNEADATCEAKPCTCPQWPCPRHIEDDANPTDANYGKQHRNRYPLASEAA